MIFGPLSAQVTIGSLIDVQRHHFQWWIVPFAVPRISHQKSVAHVLSVRLISPDRRYDRDSFRLGTCGE
jgi:hypothetical protein